VHPLQRINFSRAWVEAFQFFSSVHKPKGNGGRELVLQPIDQWAPKGAQVSGRLITVKKVVLSSHGKAMHVMAILV
jgi:hypothetical protein